MTLRNEIRGYANLSTVAQETDPAMVNHNGEIAASYMPSRSKNATIDVRRSKNATIDVVRVSQESASAYES